MDLLAKYRNKTFHVFRERRFDRDSISRGGVRKGNGFGMQRLPVHNNII